VQIDTQTAAASRRREAIMAVFNSNAFAENPQVVRLCDKSHEVKNLADIA
jgi:hypothetical protein